MLDQPRQGGLGQIEAIEPGVTMLELRDDAQRVTIVVEAAKLGHAGVERVLAGMSERRVAEIVASATASARSSSSFKALAIARAICATSMVWVRRVRKWSLS